MEYPYVWRLGEEFTQFSAVRYNEKYYPCIIDHVSSNSTEPGVGANWKTYWVLSSFNYLPKYNQGQEFFFPFFTSPSPPPPTDWRVFFVAVPFVDAFYTQDDVIGDEFDFWSSNPVAVDETGVYFAGYQTVIILGVDYFKERLEKRSLDDGSLIWVYLGDLLPI